MTDLILTIYRFISTQYITNVIEFPNSEKVLEIRGNIGDVARVKI